MNRQTSSKVMSVARLTSVADVLYIAQSAAQKGRHAVRIVACLMLGVVASMLAANVTAARAEELAEQALATIPSPYAATGETGNATASSAILSGGVYPGGSENGIYDTHYHFEYGTTTSYGSYSAEGDAGSEIEGKAVSMEVKSLTSGTTYHYRIVAWNSKGTYYGADSTFATIGANPQVAALPNGNYVLAAENNAGEMWTLTGTPGGETWTGRNMIFRMNSNSSPSIAALPNGNYILAARTNTGELWTITGKPGAETWTARNMQFGIMAGTSPSVVALPNGNYELAVQANSGELWTFTGAPGAETWTARQMIFGVNGNSSASIAALPNGNYILAAQTTSGALWTLTGKPGAETWTGHNMLFGMKAGSSPSVAGLPNGNYELAVQANSGELWTFTGAPGAETWTARQTTFEM
jgi:hypothetical protein